MNYEDRLVCFIDLLGFKSAIDQTLSDEPVRLRLYETIHDLKPEKIMNETYGSIPFFFLDEKCTVKPSKEVIKGDLRDHFGNSYPIAITQFSDSFVLSCPSNNTASCSLLLKAVYMIHLMYFYNIGMLVRGGLSIGKIIHEEGGALFGPAMNEAYRLESKEAKNPKVIMEKITYEHLKSILNGSPIVEPIRDEGNNIYSIDLIGIFQWPECAQVNDDEIESQLSAIEADIRQNAPNCLDKVHYLLDRWKKYQAKT